MWSIRSRIKYDVRTVWSVVIWGKVEYDMLPAMTGQVLNNSIVVEDDLTDYEGMALVVTFLNEKKKKTHSKSKIDLSLYGHRTERGQKVDEYMEEIRGNDRI